MTTITAVLGNSQRLDGGAMFGNAPKPLWTRWVPADERNRIPLACRAMLVKGDGPLTLVETGIGAFFDPGLRERFGVQEAHHVLLDHLAEIGVSHEDVEVVVLSHLHFDHAGGLLTAWEEGVEPRLLFPNATYVIGKEAMERARHPHFRDRASFVPGMTTLLDASGRVELVDGPATPALSGWRFHRSHGHTPGLLLPEVPTSTGPVVFAADLVPGRPWVHLPITMGYDRYPEQLIDEKRALFADLLPRGGHLFFTHDHEVALGRLQHADGRWSVTDEVAHPVEWGA